MTRRSNVHQHRGSSAQTPSPNADGIVVRARLFEALRRLRPLTMLSAPAGYGKTLLVDSWSARVGWRGTVVHVALDDDADEPGPFWASVVTSLRSNGVGASSTSTGRADRPELRSVARRIAAHEERVVLVLDCGEFALCPSVGRGLDRVIRRCGGRLSVVLLTRADPPLPLHRYRMDGAITEIRAADLAFTTSEVTSLVRSEGLRLEPRETAALQARTGGWPAGLRFAVISLVAADDPREALNDFRGDSGNVAAFLLNEVLVKQNPETRELLLRTCVADELDPGLVQALSGRPCDLQTLEVLARRNAFIEFLPGRHERYRYHSLFREFLRGQLAFEAPELVGELHVVAAEWLAGDGQVFAAIRHASLARDWPMAAELLVDRLGFADLLVGSRGQRLRRLFDGMPGDSPGLACAITRAALAVSELDCDRGASNLATARRLLREDTSGHKQVRALAIAVLTAVVTSLGAGTDGALAAALVAERAIRLAPPDDLTALLQLSAVVAGCKGRVLFERGNLEAGARALADGVTIAEAGHFDEAITELKGMSALVEAVMGRLRRATELATEVSSGVGDGADRWTVPGLEAATLALAWARTDELDLEEARVLLGQAERQMASYDSKVLGAVVSLLRARVLESGGDFELALAELRGATEPLDSGSFAAPVTGWLAESLVVAQATSLLALERSEEATALLRTLQGQGHATDDPILHQALVVAGVDQPFPRQTATPIERAGLEVQVNEWILCAEKALKVQDAARGEDFLDRALRAAAPERLRRPFTQAGKDVRALLERSGLTSRHRWLTVVVPAEESDPAGVHLPQQRRAGSESDPGSTPVVMPLTAKEAEVLGHLADLLTTDEIAETMFVSVNTVRSHVRSILRKLGVSRRNEAIRRAWELGLLAPRAASSDPVAY